MEMRPKTLIGLALAFVLVCGSTAWAATPTEAGYDYSFEHAGTTYNFEYGYYLPGEDYSTGGTNRYGHSSATGLRDAGKYMNGITGYSRMCMELARDPALVMDGPYASPEAPAYEYLFDLYEYDDYGLTGTSYEFGGFDNSKIRNLE